MWVSCVDEQTESLLYYLAKQIYPEEISTFLWYILIFKKVQKVLPIRIFFLSFYDKIQTDDRKYHK